MAGALQSLAISEVDRRDGALRSSQAEKLIASLSAFARGCSLAKDNADFGPFADAG